jgi:hypothetical protein
MSISRNLTGVGEVVTALPRDIADLAIVDDSRA